MKPKKSKQRGKRKPAGVDWREVAEQIEARPGARRDAIEDVLRSAAAEQARLRALDPDLKNAATSRAYTESLRLTSRIVGCLTTGATPVRTVENDDGPEPVFVGFEDDAADDIDLNAHLSTSFGAGASDDE